MRRNLSNPVRCKFCGRPLHPAWIPNRGHVSAHDKGDGEACRRRIARGDDLISRAEREAQRQAAREEARKR